TYPAANESSITSTAACGPRVTWGPLRTHDVYGLASAIATAAHAIARTASSSRSRSRNFRAVRRFVASRKSSAANFTTRARRRPIRWIVIGTASAVIPTSISGARKPIWVPTMPHPLAPRQGRRFGEGLVARLPRSRTGAGPENLDPQPGNPSATGDAHGVELDDSDRNVASCDRFRGRLRSHAGYRPTGGRHHRAHRGQRLGVCERVGRQQRDVLRPVD